MTRCFEGLLEVAQCVGEVTKAEAGDGEIVGRDVLATTALVQRRPLSTCTCCTRSSACCWKRMMGYRISDLEDREIYEAVENLYVLDRTQRRLFPLANLLPRALAARLHKWIGEGRYSVTFQCTIRRVPTSRTTKT